MRQLARSSRGRAPVVLALALVALCLVVAVAFGGGASPALAAGSSAARTTTTPSLTKSFPLGSHRLSRSTTTRSQSAPAGQGSQPLPGTGTRPARAAASVTPSHPSTGVWILIVLGAVALTAVVSYYGQRRLMTRAATPSQTVGEAPIAEAIPEAVPDLGPVKFLLYQDNSGGYYWTIVDEGGEVLARSAGFASYPEANYAADIVHRAAANATFENRSGTWPPPRPLASRNRSAKEDPDEPVGSPEQGGSVSREEVTRRARAAGEWPAGSSSTPGGPRR